MGHMKYEERKTQAERAASGILAKKQCEVCRFVLFFVFFFFSSRFFCFVFCVCKVLGSWVWRGRIFATAAGEEGLGREGAFAVAARGKAAAV